MKSGNLKFLENSGPLHACNGSALPFIIIRLARVSEARSQMVSCLDVRVMGDFLYDSIAVVLS